MRLLDTEYKQKSFALTSAIMVLLVIFMLFTGMTYMDPPPENGVTIAFGNSDVGSGRNVFENKPVVKERQVQKRDEGEEDILTSEDEKSVKITETKEKKVKKKDVDKKVKKEKPKPSNQTNNALSNVLGAKNKKDNSGGNGDDNLPGYKGSPNGSPYSNSFYGGGSGSGKGWGLNGRDLREGRSVPQNCNEEGRVVVRIEVDKRGNVVKATAGVKGTTNTAICLIEAARKTAMTYRWNADSDAPDRQIGFIVINFKLGE